MASDDKYDRQLRLWGPHGQRRLMHSNILLLGAGATGSESLKNLVLPGCGRVTIVDAGIVTEGDMGNNFFVTPEDLGKPRAQAVLENLLEMNDDVKGDWRQDDPATVIATEPEFFRGFSLVVATQMPHGKVTAALAATCWEANVPLIFARTCGLLGYARVVCREHRIVEAKPDNEAPDLRIANPFPELLAYADSIDLDALDAMHYAHVPYVVLLIKFMQAWKAEHGGAAPATYAEKNAFKEFVKSKGRKPHGQEDNFIEAASYWYQAYVPRGVPDEVRAVLDDKAAGADLGAGSEHFWFIAAAVRDFVANEGGGELPVAGKLPDMTSTTDGYLELQRVYAAKGEADLAAVRARVTGHLEAAGLPAGHVPDDEVARFCANAHYVRVMRTRSLAEEMEAGSLDPEDLEDEIDCTPAEGRAQMPLAWYLTLRAADAFAAKHGRVPGDTDDTVEADAAEVRAEAAALTAALGVGKELVTADHAAEVARFGGSEPHVVAALVGGVVAQEAVKLITHQYEPLDNTFMFNGITTCSAVYKM